MKKGLFSIFLIFVVIFIIQSCTEGRDGEIQDITDVVTTDILTDTTYEDITSKVSTLRGYFCETDRDCDESEVCLQISGITDRVCQPSAFVTFLDSTTFIIDTAELEPDFVKDEKGREKPVIKGFSNLSSPGDPDIPSITLNVLIPPDSDINQIKAVIINEESYEEEGTYEIAPAGPANFRPDKEGAPTYEDWIKDKEYIVDGYNTRVYSKDALFTEEPIRILPPKQMRKWLFVPIQFFPLRYNPVKKTLTRTGYLKVHIETPKVQAISPLEINRILSDSLFDSDAEKIFVNFSKMVHLYKPLYGYHAPPPQNKYDYVIITTSSIRNSLTNLSRFIEHKQSIGYKVFVADESVWGRYQGVDGPEKVRNWLRENYINMGIQYVLLLADPNDRSGPAMRECWPRAKEKRDDWERTPTDVYYSDLSGNWNKNNDDLWCEYYGDYRNGGVDLTPEVYVGRIPVYPGRYNEADKILLKTVNYERSKDIEWRYNVLLPNPISDYSQEEERSESGTGTEIKRNGFTVDGAKFAERMKSDFLNAQNKFRTVSLYEKRGPEPSVYQPDIEFSQQNVINEWRKGYGLISWSAHGNSTSSAGKVWKADTNNDKIAQKSEKEWEDFADSSFPESSYNPEKPAFTSQVSCLNSRPDSSSNLSYTLLVKGGAITTMGGTSVTLYTPYWNYPNSNRMDNVSFGYYYTRNISKNYPAGKALALTRSMSTSLSWGDGSLMNILSFNLYGDPSLSLLTTYTPSNTTNDTSFKDNGHSFDKNAYVGRDPALKWSLFYSFTAPQGKLKVVVEILKDRQPLKDPSNQPVISFVEHSVDPSTLLKFDGDNPDIITLNLSKLRFLGVGTFNLAYRIRYTFTDNKGQTKDLLLTDEQNFSIEFKQSENVITLKSGVQYNDSFTTSMQNKFYRFVAPAQGRLRVDLKGPEDADFDLYIKEGSQISTSSYDRRAYGSTADEIIEMDVVSGEYSILVNRYSGSGDFTIVATFTDNDNSYPELVPGTLATGTLPARYKTKVYKVNITKSGKFTAILEAPTGSVVDLYLKKDKVPTTTSYYTKSSGSTNTPEISASVSSGTYYLMIRTRKGSGTYSLLGELQ